MNLKTTCLATIFAVALSSRLAADIFMPANGYVFNSSNHLTSSDHVWIWNNATVSMVSGGFIDAVTEVRDQSKFNISGGQLNLMLMARDSSTVNVSGGSLYGILATGPSKINITGGNISGALHGYGNSPTFNIYGGSFSTLILEGSATFNIYGENLVKNESTHKITGTLANGTPINVIYIPFDSPTGTINIYNVPEPSTYAFAVSGAVGLIFAMRRRKKA
jgi:hypothetical protein